VRVCVCVVRRLCVGARCMAVCREHVFKDSSLFYRFVDDEATPADADCDDVDVRQCRDDLVDVVSYLCQIAPDAAMRMILRKPYDILAFFLDADTALQRSPRRHSWWGGEHLSPRTPPLSAFYSRSSVLPFLWTPAMLSTDWLPTQQQHTIIAGPGS